MPPNPPLDTVLSLYQHLVSGTSYFTLGAGYSKTSGEHWTIEIYKNQWASGVTICLLIFLAMEEHESQVLQVECSMECSLLGEQEQSHSEGTDIVHGRWYLLWNLIIYMEKFLESDWLRAVQFLVNTVQKQGNIMQK